MDKMRESEEEMTLLYCIAALSNLVVDEKAAKTAVAVVPEVIEVMDVAAQHSQWMIWVSDFCRNLIQTSANEARKVMRENEFGKVFVSIMDPHHGHSAEFHQSEEALCSVLKLLVQVVAGHENPLAEEFVNNGGVKLLLDLLPTAEEVPRIGHKNCSSTRIFMTAQVLKFLRLNSKSACKDTTIIKKTMEQFNLPLQRNQSKGMWAKVLLTFQDDVLEANNLTREDVTEEANKQARRSMERAKANLADGC